MQRKRLFTWALIMLSVVFGAAVAQATPLISNGSFELGIDPGGGGFQTLNAPNYNINITDWNVTAGSVDYISSYWQASDGSRSLDMNGLGTGSIAQTFATTNGQKYAVTFDLAGNFDGDPNPKTLTASVTGTALPFSFSFSKPVNWDKQTNMGWVHEAFTFTANSAATLLTFTGDPTNLSGWPDGTPWGPALDNVAATAVPLPPSALLLGSGLLGLGLLRRKWSLKQ